MPLRTKMNVEEIFKTYKDKVCRLAISIVRNDADAKDVMQITLNTFCLLKHLK